MAQGPCWPVVPPLLQVQSSFLEKPGCPPCTNAPLCATRGASGVGAAVVLFCFHFSWDRWGRTWQVSMSPESVFPIRREHVILKHHPSPWICVEPPLRKLTSSGKDLGLQRSGLDPTHFTWTPGGPPPPQSGGEEERGLVAAGDKNSPALLPLLPRPAQGRRSFLSSSGQTSGSSSEREGENPAPGGHCPVCQGLHQRSQP